MRGASRLAVPVFVAAAAIAGGMLAPAGCFFPSYTFDKPGSGGGGAASSSSSSSSTSSGTGGSSSSSSSGSSSSSSSSSSGVVPCASQDCSDPTCTDSFACAPALPTGWTGYFALYDGPASGDPGCPSAFPTSDYVGNNQIDAAAATCSKCTCDAPQGQSCKFKGPASSPMPTWCPNCIDAFYVVDAACNASPNCGAVLEVPDTWDGQCFGQDQVPSNVNTCGTNAGASCSAGSSPCNVSAQASGLQVTGGSCAPSTQAPTIKAVAWGAAGEACGDGVPTGKGCSGTTACLPKPQPPFIGLCVYQDGDVGCPPGQFSEKHTFFSGADDQRKCSDCACGSPTGSTCSATVTLYSDSTINTCNAAHVVATLHPTSQGGDCVALAGNTNVASRMAVFDPITGGSCTPSGGQPTGTATATGARTYCCIP